ncbi:DUF4177 domain-containing protein [Gorillibacterium timonense]|uniref:DUF4177 domain-containing protein n=1 Tax=Gorillibacterium timonense TaxID=1689269 RepID=UPI00071D603F|nr:DUF4177 domain-containing protein [Gorillibacterium timonense]
MERWEYKTIQVKTSGFWGGKLDDNEFELHLNALGNEGWELVSVFDTNQAQGATMMVVAVFKRRK